MLQRSITVMLALLAISVCNAESKNINQKWNGHEQYGHEVCSWYLSMWADIPFSTASFYNQQFAKDMDMYKPASIKVDRGGIFPDFRGWKEGQPGFPQTREELEKVIADIHEITTAGKEIGIKIQTYSAIYDIPLSGTADNIKVHWNPSSWELYNDILGSIPQDKAITWLQVDSNGNPKIVPYWRRPTEIIEYYGCVNNPNFYKYVEGFWRGELYAGINGGYNDNPLFCKNACYCEFCKAGFKEFITNRFKQKELKKYFDMKKGEQIEIPKDKSSPLSLQWRVFKEKSMMDFHRRLRDNMHKVNPESEITCNMSQNPESLGGVSDYIYLEVSASPRRDDNKCLTNMSHYRFLSASSRGNRSHPLYLPHYFNKGPDESCYARCLLQLAEAASCGLSYEVHLSQCRTFEPYGRSARDWYQFIRKYGDIYKKQSNFADVAVVCSSSFFYTEKKVSSARHSSAHNLLTDGTIPAVGILSQDLVDSDLVLKYRCIVLPPVPMLSIEETEGLIKYVRSGGALIIAGVSGTHDKRAVPYDKNVLRKLYRILGVDLKSSKNLPIATSSFGNGQLVYLSISDTEDKIPELSAILERMRQSQPLVEVKGSNFIKVTLMHRKDPPAILVNLLNYDVTIDREIIPAKDISLTLEIPKGRTVSKVSRYSPNDKPVNPDYKIDKKTDFIRIVAKIPEINIYSGILVELN